MIAEFLIGSVVGGPSGYFFARFLDRRRHTDPSPEDDFVNLVTGLLNDRPDLWTTDGYRMRFKNPMISIWIANEINGLGINLTVDASPRDFNLSVTARGKIYAAAIAWKIKKAERDVVDLAQAVVDNVVPINGSF